MNHIFISHSHEDSATFDGSVFRPDQPIELEPNTRVRLIEPVKAPSEKSESFLRVARS